MFFHERHKKHRFRSRLVALLGILPGIWFLVATQTQLREQVKLQCGYWFIMLFIMTFIWLFYASLIMMIIKDARHTIAHAHSLNEKHTAQIAKFSVRFESLFAGIIFLLSALGFILTDASCMLSRFLEQSGVGLMSY